MKELHDWFLQNQREFPWRGSPTPYEVWISEVMLQQTRASVVIPYFEKWLKIFPNVRALANSSLEQVIKAWEGLGYYSRARNLHRAAQQIVEKFSGEIPSKKEDLASIHGIGPYTLGAILSFGFRQRSVALDGNVMRVASRLFLVEENICKVAVKRKIAEMTESILDEKEPWVTMEALIELGATICTPKPQCGPCPLQKKCLGKEKALSLPIKNGEKQITSLKRAVIWIEAEGKVLVKKGEAGKVMADLYEFPYFEMGKEIVQEVQKMFGLKVVVEKRLKTVSHTFTRFKAQLYPFLCKAKILQPVDGYEWVLKPLLSDLPFSSGHRRILDL